LEEFDPSLRWVGIGGLSFASLILTHNITAYMFFPFILLLCFFRIFFLENKLKSSVNLLSALALGLLISCYFWLPALLDSNLVKYDTIYNFIDHFPTILQLIKPYWGYGPSVPGPYDGMSFFIGTVNLVILILGLFLTIINWSKLTKDKKIILIWALISIVCAVFLMNYRSTFIWEKIPLLPYFQFPWRFLVLTTFATPIFIITLDMLSIRKIAPIVVIILTIATTVSDFHPHDFLARLDSYYLNKYIPVPFASDEYLKIQEEYLRLPKATEKRPEKNYPLISINSGIIKNSIRVNDLNSIVEVDSKNGLKLDYAKYFFPGWIARIDGLKTTILSGKPFGQIEIDVPAGTHKVEVSFEETIFKKVLDAISFLSFLVSLWMVKNLWLQSKKIGSLF
jgi:hypothetical protein